MPEPLPLPNPLTLAHYWEKFTKDDRTFLQIHLHVDNMGLLPFKPADEAFLAAYRVIPYSSGDTLCQCRILYILQAHNTMLRVDHTLPKDRRPWNREL